MYVRKLIKQNFYIPNVTIFLSWAFLLIKRKVNFNVQYLIVLFYLWKRAIIIVCIPLHLLKSKIINCSIVTFQKIKLAHMKQFAITISCHVQGLLISTVQCRSRSRSQLYVGPWCATGGHWTTPTTPESVYIHFASEDVRGYRAGCQLHIAIDQKNPMM